MADPMNNNDGSPSHIHVEKKKINWLPWLALLLGLLALIWWLTRDRDHATTAVTTTTTEAVATSAAPVAATAGAAGTSALGGYFAGTEAAPRTFTFEKLNFDTASAAIRPQDQDEVDSIAATLTQYGTSRVRIVGYADARGDAAANATLGQQRADSVKAALTAKGIDAARIETGTGGESDPAATNATTPGMAENRRTELVVLSR